MATDSSTLYPIGIQNFEELRNGGYLYIDKTEFIHTLVTKGKYYFLSRPRRFGKSLLVSTIEAIFLGKRTLFEGLAISGHDFSWERHPVLHIDFSPQDYTSDNSLDIFLDNWLRTWEKRYDVRNPTESYSLRFARIIEKAAESSGKNVVILIDEYDKPLVSNIFNPERQSRFREMLKGFYSVIKAYDGKLRFAFMTGVTKFGRVSIFSDINNLNDISIDYRFNSICGISESELLRYFNSDIALLAANLGYDEEHTLRRLKSNYDGYCFTPEVARAEGVYNPFSLMNAFWKMRLGNYWFVTGTPTVLVNLIKQRDIPIENLDGARRHEDTLLGLDMVMKDPIPMIYQTGYLTIKSYDARRKEVTLGYPNEEVRESWLRFILPLYANPSLSTENFNIYNLIDFLENGDIDGYLTTLQAFMANIPYDHTPRKTSEGRLHDIVYITSALIGLHLRTEYHTAAGRIDLVIDTSRRIYIIEFKLDKSAKAAAAQIDRLDYSLPFAASHKEIIKVGVAFSSARRNISSWKVISG